MHSAKNSKLAAALALSISLTLGACGGMPTNRGLESTKQPVVERTNHTLDVSAGLGGGLAISEQHRLADWFKAMDLRYGDRVAIDDPMMNKSTRDAIGALAARHGILLSDGAPVTSAPVSPGYARVVITRAKASVPGCPDWSVTSDSNYHNATNPNYGCAINGNLAAMIANPEDLIRGQSGSGQTQAATATKAIESYRNQAPTGEGGLAQTQTNESGG